MSRLEARRPNVTRLLPQHQLSAEGEACLAPTVPSDFSALGPRLWALGKLSNALAWDLITCLNHQIKDQAEQVLGVSQEAASALVLHFREQVQKQGEVTLDLLSFQILQKLVQQVQKRKMEKDDPPVLEGLGGNIEPSETPFSMDLVRESLDEDDFSHRSIGSYLSALRTQFTFGDYI